MTDKPYTAAAYMTALALVVLVGPPLIWGMEAVIYMAFGLLGLAMVAFIFVVCLMFTTGDQGHGGKNG